MQVLQADLNSPNMADRIRVHTDPWRYKKWIKMELLEGELPGPKPSYEERLYYLSEDDEYYSDDEAEEDYDEDDARKESRNEIWRIGWNELDLVFVLRGGLR